MSRITEASAPGRSQDADHSAIAELQQRMEKLLTELDREAVNYANARQCQEFMSDRKKSALADAFTGIQQTDPEASATSLEHRARASGLFKDKMKDLMRDYLIAETRLANYDLLKTRLDVARSLLAVERAKLERL